MKLLKILLILFLCLPLVTKAQLLINTQGQQITLSQDAVMTIPSSVENLGAITNNGGFIYISGDWTNGGTYDAGTGHFILNGSSLQTIDHDGQTFFILTIDGGGNKVMSSDITVIDSLILVNGIVDLNTSTRNLLLDAGAVISGGNNSSYVDGALTQTGTGDLFYPIGKNGNYTPATLLDVRGENPRITLEAFDSNPEAMADSGLVQVSNLRYWQRTLESGSFEKSRIRISMTDETAITSVNKGVVAAGQTTNGSFKNFGRARVEGTLTNGALESTAFLDNTTDIIAVGEELNENRVADSLALIALYESLAGDAWTNNTNWNSNNPINTWFGVTVTNDRVTGISLPNNGLKGMATDALRLFTELTSLDLSDNSLSGALGEAITELSKLSSLNLSGNQLVELPDFSTLPVLTSLDVSNNQLPFATLIPNAVIPGIILSPQDTLGENIIVTAQEGEEVTLSITEDHGENAYQWYKNGEVIAGANAENLMLSNVQFEDMADYNCGITNTNINGVELISATQQLEVYANLGGQVVLATDGSTPFSEGEIILFTEGSFGYDTVEIKALADDGTFTFENKLLGDYFLQVRPNEADADFMSTYYESTIISTDATTIEFRNDTSSITVLELQRPSKFTPEQGNNTCEGFFEIEEEFLQNARIEARRRVKLAGVSLYRSKNRLRVDENLEEIDLSNWDLVAYTQTNENGEFRFDNVPDGNYRIIIDYPGIPIASGSNIDFTLSEAEDQTSISFEAAIDDPEEGIVVKETKILHTKFDLIEAMSIYPNPAGDFISLQLDTRKNYTIRLSIVDIKGLNIFSRIISRQDTIDDRIVLDVSNISPGIYTIVLSDPEGDEGQLKAAKLMITR